MIYCVEDDKNIQELIIYSLKTIGYDACGFNNFHELYEKLNEIIPKMILLDIMLPQKDGLSILTDLKRSAKTKNIPVILITAKGSEYDKVKGLDLGADDYITKPFGMMELLSRVKAVLRRCDSNTDLDEIRVLSLYINKKNRTVQANGKPISLSFKEYELLQLLMQNKNKVFTRDNLLTSIWGYDYDGESRTIDVHIRTLRQKLGEDARIIKTIRNVGYMVGD